VCSGIRIGVADPSFQSILKYGDVALQRMRLPRHEDELQEFPAFPVAVEMGLKEPRDFEKTYRRMTFDLEVKLPVMMGISRGACVF
jgi:hypothetical protein